jgi:hypothetical protein
MNQKKPNYLTWILIQNPLQKHKYKPKEKSETQNPLIFPEFN